MMNKIIFIDTSDNKKITIGIEINGRKELIFSDSHKLRSQACLVLIDSLLKKHNLKIVDIDEVRVTVGPGSFTGLRVGVAIANTFANFLNIPVNQKQIGELEEPVYN